jgi:hypothetical protein
MNYDIRDVIERRAEFLIAEAQSRNPTSDHAIRFTLRCLSNYVQVGGDYGSLGVSRRLRYRSPEAHQLLQKLTGTPRQRYSAWGKLIRNEHPEPLGVTWSRLKATRPDELTPAEVCRQLAEWPMVVVTIEQDIALRIPLPPFDRYRQAGVRVLTGDPLVSDGWVEASQFASP